MTKFVKKEGSFGLQPELGYPKYFGYHPEFRGISELIRIQPSYLPLLEGKDIKVKIFSIWLGRPEIREAQGLGLAVEIKRIEAKEKKTIEDYEKIIELVKQIERLFDPEEEAKGLEQKIQSFLDEHPKIRIQHVQYIATPIYFGEPPKWGIEKSVIIFYEEGQ